MQLRDDASTCRQMFSSLIQSMSKELKPISLLQQTITWCKIHHAGGQAYYYSRTGTLKQRDLNQ